MKNSISLLMVVLLGVLGYLPSTAQQYFNKRYTVSSGGIVFSSVLQHNKKYYVASICNDSINHIGGGLFKALNGVKFIVLDSVGNVISSKLYQRSDKIFTGVLPQSLAVSNNFIQLANGTFLYSFTVKDTALASYNASYNNHQAAIVKFDSLGNVLMYKEYDRPYCLTSDATNQIMRDFKPDAFGNWLMLTSKICNKALVFCLRKIDSNFNEIWVKDFKTNTNNHLPGHMLIENDGYVMSGSIDNGNSGVSHTNYYTSVLIKCDTAGNKFWDWQNSFDTTKLQYTINDIIRSKDGGYIYCGTGEGRPLYYATGEWADIKVYGYVEKLDASRNSVWKRRLGYLFAGVNQNSQNIIKELPNGDLMVAGTMAKYYDEVKERGNTKASLTKLSGVDGSIIWQRIYYYNPDTLSGFIYDMRQTADGGYILAGETKDDVVFPFDAPTQRGWLIKVDSNGCEWAGSPCNPTHISPLQSGLEAGFKVYPNPSNGTLLIASSSLRGTKQSGTINTKIYDLLGRVVHQEPLNFSNNTATLQIQVPTGMYILELQSKEGVLHRERIVIE